MRMTGYIPTNEDIAKMVRDLKKKDPENANPTYARQMLIRTKLMYRHIGSIDEGMLHKEKASFEKKKTKN